MLVGTEGGNVPMDFQGYLEVDEIVLGDWEFPIRTALKEGNLIFDDFVTRGVFHDSATPSSPGHLSDPFLNYSVFWRKALTFIGYFFVFSEIL